MSAGAMAEFDSAAEEKPEMGAYHDLGGSEINTRRRVRYGHRFLAPTWRMFLCEYGAADRRSEVGTAATVEARKPRE
jgi:hypothetical protein